MSDLTWPELPTDPKARAEAEKARYQAELDLRKNTLDRLAVQQDAARKATDDLRSAVHAAYIDVAKQSLDRSLARAQFISAVTGTIVTLYTGLLALVYSVSDKGSQPLPARGIVPAVFLGLALTLSAIYVSFLRRDTIKMRLLPAGLSAELDESRLHTFLEWVTEGVLQRAWALRTALISLGVGVTLLPLPFVALSNWQVATAIGIGAAVVVGWVLVAELVVPKLRPRREQEMEPLPTVR